MGRVVFGVDVGGTNTDAAAVSDEGIVVAKAKVTTSEDIVSGVVEAVNQVQKILKSNSIEYEVQYLVLGTTHFLNAIVERRSEDLAKVSVLRCCGYSSRATEPYIDFPDDLRDLIFASHTFLEGGFQFDHEPISNFCHSEIRESILAALKGFPPDHQVVVSGIHSNMYPEHELDVEKIIKTEFPQMGVTCSHGVGCMGLLERENSAILNAALRPLALKTIKAFKEVFSRIGLKNINGEDCPLYLTQNNGTLISCEEATVLPVRAIACGTTNSMRGARFLSHEPNAIVLDIGGTTTDVGVLVNGFPRPCGGVALIGGVRTGFGMPDVLSIGLGGGSLVDIGAGGQATVGPRSVGHRLTKEAMCFGGAQVTATDIAVCRHGPGILGPACAARPISAEQVGGPAAVKSAVETMQRMVEAAVDRVKTSPEPMPVVLVGGGSVLLRGCSVAGASRLVLPEHFDVTNAVGAALSQVSATVERVLEMAGPGADAAEQRAAALAALEGEAREAVVRAGALPGSVEVAGVEQTPIQYLENSNLVRVAVRAVGDLLPWARSTDPAGPTPPPEGAVRARAGHTVTQTACGSQPAAAPCAAGVVRAVVGGPEAHSGPTGRADPSSGMWELTLDDVDAIAVGVGILGCGGGGSQHCAAVRARREIAAGRAVRVLSPEALGAEDWVFPVAFFGVPTVLAEKQCSGAEMAAALDAVRSAVGGAVVPRALMPAEVGGTNGMEPMLLAARLGLPLLDADFMGRAFPQLNMSLPYILGASPFPLALGDAAGRSELLTRDCLPPPLAAGAGDNRAECLALEGVLRGIVGGRFGMVAGLALPPMRGEDVPRLCLRFTLTRAWRIGRAVLAARAAKRSVVAELLREERGRLLFRGKVSNVVRTLEGGYNRGVVTVVGLAGDEDFEGRSVRVDVQNENLVVWDGESGKALACVPCIIAVLDSDTGDSIFTEAMRYGLRVAVVALPCHPALRTPVALEVVGPAAFGYPGLAYQAPDSEEE